MWSNLGIGSVLIIGYFIDGRPAGLLGIAGARPRENWEVQLHLLMKLVGSSLATGFERIEIQAHLRDLEERNELALHSANDGLWDFDTLNNRVYLSPRWKADARLRRGRRRGRRRTGARSCIPTTCRGCRRRSAITSRARRRYSRACTACAMPPANGAG